MIEKAKVARIDEDTRGTVDEIGIAVIGRRGAPKEAVNSIRNLHELTLFQKSRFLNLSGSYMHPQPLFR
jgi:hypothetical protein